MAEDMTVEQTEEKSAPKGDRAEQKAEQKKGRFDTDAPLFVAGPYVEDPNWVPSPFDQYGTVQTAGVSGDNVHGDITEVSPAFQMGRARSLIHGARALDPDDPTPMDNVVLPNADHRTEETARDILFAAAQKHLDEPVELGMTQGRRDAAVSSVADSEPAEGDEWSGRHEKDEKSAESGPPSASSWQKDESQV